MTRLKTQMKWIKLTLSWVAGVAVLTCWTGAAVCEVVLTTQALCWRIAEAIEGPAFRAERQQPAETHDQWLQNGHGTDLYSESQWLERSLKHRSDGQRKGPETAP